MAVIMGTSTCHLCCSPAPQFVRGVWGPFRDALGNGLWVAEGGQSATGKLLDHLLETHPAWGQLQAEVRVCVGVVWCGLAWGWRTCPINPCLSDTSQSPPPQTPKKPQTKQAAAHGEHPQQHLHSRLQRLAAASHTPLPLLAHGIHLLPHWAGARSPEADPELTGAIVGLTFDTSLDALARLYLAAVQALALGTKHIVDALEKGGHGPITHLLVSGGLGVKNRLLLQAHADATGRALVLPGGSDEAVLLGAAVVAAVAAGLYPSVDEGMREMTRAGEVVAPDADPAVRRLYAGKERVYHALRGVQVAARGAVLEG